MIIFGWKALEEVQQKLASKHSEIQQQYQGQLHQESPNDKPSP
jgi:hypothetical protein